MTNPNHDDLSGLHHYPPTSANWVSSPLAREDEMPPNPLEHSSGGMPRFRQGAVLVLVGGLLALVGSVLQIVHVSDLPDWSLWLVTLASLLAIGTVVGSITLLVRETAVRARRAVLFACASAGVQLVEIVVMLALASPRSGLQAAMWISAGSMFLLLVGASVLRLSGQLKLSGQDLADQAEKDKRMVEFTKGGKFLGVIPFGSRSTHY